MRRREQAPLPAAHGYATSFRIGAVLLAIGGLLALALFERVSTDVRNPLAETESQRAPSSTEPVASPAG